MSKKLIENKPELISVKTVPFTEIKESVTWKDNINKRKMFHCEKCGTTGYIPHYAIMNSFYCPVCVNEEKDDNHNYFNPLKCGKIATDCEVNVFESCGTPYVALDYTVKTVKKPTTKKPEGSITYSRYVDTQKLEDLVLPESIVAEHVLCYDTVKAIKNKLHEKYQPEIFAQETDSNPNYYFNHETYINMLKFVNTKAYKALFHDFDFKALIDSYDLNKTYKIISNLDFDKTEIHEILKMTKDTFNVMVSFDELMYDKYYTNREGHEIRPFNTYHNISFAYTMFLDFKKVAEKLLGEKNDRKSWALVTKAVKKCLSRKFTLKEFKGCNASNSQRLFVISEMTKISGSDSHPYITPLEDKILVNLAGKTLGIIKKLNSGKKVTSQEESFVTTVIPEWARSEFVVRADTIITFLTKVIHRYLALRTLTNKRATEIITAEDIFNEYMTLNKKTILDKYSKKYLSNVLNFYESTFYSQEELSDLDVNSNLVENKITSHKVISLKYISSVNDLISDDLKISDISELHEYVQEKLSNGEVIIMGTLEPTCLGNKNTLCLEFFCSEPSYYPVGSNYVVNDFIVNTENKMKCSTYFNTRFCMSDILRNRLC